MRHPLLIKFWSINATGVQPNETTVSIIGHKDNRWERLCVFVIAKRYPEKRAVITTNDDDDVYRHQPITISDCILHSSSVTLTAIWWTKYVHENKNARKRKLFSSLLSKLYI